MNHFVLSLLLAAWLALLGPQPVAAQDYPPVNEALLAGLAHNLEQVVSGLTEEKRTPAVKALDAARRVAEVGSHGAAEAQRQTFSRAAEEIRRIRHALQMGRPRHALDMAREAHRHLPTAGGGEAPSPPPPEQQSRYRGATLINARGEKIGEILGFAVDPTSGDVEVEAALGHGRDVWGFIDLGGDKVRFPIGMAAFGRPKALGTTLVAISPALSLEALMRHFPLRQE